MLEAQCRQTARWWKSIAVVSEQVKIIIFLPIFIPLAKGWIQWWSAVIG